MSTFHRTRRGKVTLTLRSLQSARSHQITFVDSARLGDVGRPEDIQGKGTLTNTEWANELHPKPRGFNKIVRSCWAPAFAAAGLMK